MLNLMMQLQMLLTALSALLPLIPVDQRGRAAEFLDVAARALAVGGTIAGNLDDLARKLAAIRGDVEAMAAAGRAVTPGELDAAIIHVRTASAAFRAALETAEASTA
ncbi:MAG: hypothetical protein ABL864_03190 [Terricaulis sp.]